MEENKLPVEELKKFGIMNSEEKFSSKLAPKDIDTFLKGGTLIAEDDKNTLTFKLNKEKLDINVYSKDVVNHKDLASNEIFEIASKEKSLYKVMADYGTIVNKGEAHFNNNSSNEKTFFVELANERGKTKFYGNDLIEKLKYFTVGDQIQIKNSGISKAELLTKDGEQEKVIHKYDTIFKIEALNDNNKTFQSKIFELDPKTKTILDLDTTKLDLKTVNGAELSKEQLEKLRKGKQVNLDGETIIQISPKAQNEKKLTSNARNLLLLSIAVDGGLSFMILKGIQKLKQLEREKTKQLESSKYEVELQKLKGLLETKSGQYPENKKIISDLNIVGKELSDISLSKPKDKVQEKSKNTSDLKVVDRNLFEEARRDKEENQQLENSPSRSLKR